MADSEKVVMAGSMADSEKVVMAGSMTGASKKVENLKELTAAVLDLA